MRFIASMLSIPCEERYGALAMTPQKHKDETLRTLVDLIEAAARKQPTVMLFEDVHWADPTILEVLDLLIDRVRTIPLLIVLTHRPEFSLALVAARACHGAEPVQAHARAKRGDRVQARRRQGTAPASCSSRSWPRPTACRCLWKS